MRQWPGRRIPPGVFTRELFTICGVSFLQLMTVMTSFILVPQYIRHLGGSDFTVGIQSTIFTLFSVIFRIFLGPMADIKGRKPPLLLGAAVFSSTPILIFLSPNFTVMALVRLYQAIGMATYLSAATSYVADVTPEKYRGTGMGMYRTSVTMSVMVGPALGMAVIDAYGFGLYFMGMTLLGGLGFLLLLTLKESLPVSKRLGGASAPNPVTAVSAPMGTSLETGETFASGGGAAGAGAAGKVTPKELAALFSIARLRGSYLAIFLFSGTGGIILTFTTLYTCRFPDIPNPAIYFTIHAAAGALAATILGNLSDRYGRDKFLSFTIYFFALGILLLSIMGIFPRLLFGLSAFCAGVGFTAGLALYIARVVDSVPRRLRASALAFQESAIDLGNTVGIFIFGLSTGVFRYEALYLGMAVITAAIPVIVRLSEREKNPKRAEKQGKEQD